MTSVSHNTGERVHKRPTVSGTVTSSKMHKTIVVEVTRLAQHERYSKYLRHRSRFYAHDERGEAKVGDFVEIGETRPLSKTKRWRLLRVIRRAVVSGPAVAGHGEV
jgi:small subunit ribosomal protein S17